MIPYGRQSIDQDDLDAVIEVLKSDFLTTGPKVKEFEQELAVYSGFAHCVSYNSATSALHCACLALGVNEASHVWVPTMSFVATANCAEYCGATTQFIDIDADTGQMDLDLLATALKEHRDQSKPLPDVVIPVHYAGHLCDMPRLTSLANEYGFKLIEDASHALGATAPESWSATDRGDIIIYSFHPVKMITSGEGGAALTDSPELAQKLKLFGNHGITKDAALFKYPERTEPWYYEQQVLGFNYRMSDIQAALGLSQLKKLDRFVQRRRQLASRYRSAFQNTAVIPVSQQNQGESSYHLFPVLLPEDIAGRVFKRLHEQKIFVQKHYIPIPAQPYFEERYHVNPASYALATQFCQRVVALPIYIGLSDDLQDFVIKAVKEALP